jgi:hypothetical protein
MHCSVLTPHVDSTFLIVGAGMEENLSIVFDLEERCIRIFLL